MTPNPSDYASAIACLKRPTDLSSTIPLEETNIDMGDYVLSTAFHVGYSEELCRGFALYKDVTGGAINDHTHTCISCR